MATGRSRVATGLRRTVYDFPPTAMRQSIFDPSNSPKRPRSLVGTPPGLFRGRRGVWLGFTVRPPQDAISGDNSKTAQNAAIHSEPVQTIANPMRPGESGSSQLSPIPYACTFRRRRSKPPRPSTPGPDRQDRHRFRYRSEHQLHRPRRWTRTDRPLARRVTGTVHQRQVGWGEVLS
jgi:hypothetical protein